MYKRFFENLITHEQAIEFIEQFNSIAEGKCELELIGSLAEEGSTSNHDIDTLLTILDQEWYEDYLEVIDEDLANPVYTEFMLKLGAKLITVSSGMYDDYNQNPDTWIWNGIIIDVFYGQE